ncbi:hypothetical protein ASH01_11530 [Terrabacter sp. Soil811]|uniref:restriction system modified-DNA reader domain-containing protein n=1 Tax=Terrabacter sp. Soil811 TaxID=1736419 RepID=UPI0006F63209|nr:DUF4357 domain-containing protein [Terrabacter sp. Soil811]KRF44616.1 hypothetical protein ASH01_11530 [Terrabacter sp. Soil811]
MYVEIDNDLAELLEQHMRLDEPLGELVNRMLRAAVDGKGRRGLQPTPPARRRTVGAGQLLDLLRAGLVNADDAVEFTERRRGIVHRGRVTADGLIATDGRPPAAPSGALGQLVGYSINGWKSWVHVPTGKTLSALRDGLAS